MNKVKIHVGLVGFALVSVALIVTAFMPAPEGTTPYKIVTPNYYLSIQSPSDNPTTVEGVALGRKLFYDPIISGNQKQACSGCHKQELAFTDGLPISMGSAGNKARRNSMTLVNLGWQDKFFWDGRAASLEDLIHFPVTDVNEMNTKIPELEARLNSNATYKSLFKKAFGKDVISMPLVAKALSQFLRTIVSYNSEFELIINDKYYQDGRLNYQIMPSNELQFLQSIVGQGSEKRYGGDTAISKWQNHVRADTKVLAAFAKCVTCHYNSIPPPCTGSNCDGTVSAQFQVLFRNNGLEKEGPDRGLYEQSKKEEDKYKFKVPTFRNLIFTAPYMHDGRFKTLEEVVDHYNNGIEANQNLDPLLRDSATHQPIRFGLDEDEKKQLVAILKLFTDSSMVTDKRFSAPGK